MTAILAVSPAVWSHAHGLARPDVAHADSLSDAPTGTDLASVGARCFLSTDGQSGYVIVAGDLRLVFSTVRGRGDALVASAILHGARTLDCFDGYLPTLYARHGFRVIRREANWTPGGPDVVFMAR